MKTDLQKRLAQLAPSISIETIWEPDTDCGPISKKWDAWQSEIRATAICNGEEITGSAYLGGTWELYGDNPAESNPTISGYEIQMTVEALNELMDQIPAGSGYLTEYAAALDYLATL